jgi:tripartite-type tricarboxylate transporter receptor subunit TctC
LLFVTSDAVPAKDLKDFVALAKSKPGALNYASVGTASQAQLVTELFARTAGITMQHIPYRGGAPAVTSLLTGDTQFAVLSPQVSLPQMETGKMRALGAGSLTRDPQFPNIPTVAEQGYPDFEAVQWVGLLAPKGMPPGVVEKLNAEINRAIRTPDMIAKFAQQGMSPAGGTPQKFQSVIVHEIKVWTEVARAADIKSP